MFYALVHYPTIDKTLINQFRRKYDPQIDLIEPHITLVFPVPESIGEEYLVSHIESVLSKWKPFPLHLEGFHRSQDDCLFLIVQEGNAKIINLHNELYTGILANYCRQDISYIPHITLGFFVTNSSEYSQALIEANQLKLDYRCIMDKLHLVKINADKSQINLTKEFAIKKSAN